MGAPSELAGARGSPEPGRPICALEFSGPEPAFPPEFTVQSEQEFHMVRAGSFKSTAVRGACVCLTTALRAGAVRGRSCELGRQESVSPTYTCVHPHITHTGSHTFARTYTHTQIRPYTHIHITDTHICVHIHTYTHARTRVHIHTRTHIYTRTHTAHTTHERDYHVTSAVITGPRFFGT